MLKLRDHSLVLNHQQDRDPHTNTKQIIDGVKTKDTF